MSEICTLISMGFSRNVAENALRKKGGNVEQAIDYLLSPKQEQHESQVIPSKTENAENSTSQASNISSFMDEPKYKIFSSALSQYNLTYGKSACTFIALAGVQILLPHFSYSNVDTNPEFIDRCLFQGVEKYQCYHSDQGGVEHSSPEEVLPFHDDLEWVNQKVEQGILKLKSTDSDNSFLPMLSKLQDADEYRAVVITKPPETVVTFLPPRNSNIGSYTLFDSHSRPGIEGAYIKMHTVMEDLIQSLEEVFPVVDLGEESLNMMYNSFDLYLLRCVDKKKS